MSPECDVVRKQTHVYIYALTHTMRSHVRDIRALTLGQSSV